jgi:hypothetical protein
LTLRFWNKQIKLLWELQMQQNHTRSPSLPLSLSLSLREEEECDILLSMFEMMGFVSTWNILYLLSKHHHLSDMYIYRITFFGGIEHICDCLLSIPRQVRSVSQFSKQQQEMSFVKFSSSRFV